VFALGTSTSSLSACTGCALPHSDVNWGNFTPTKVRVFFWVSSTATRAHGTSSPRHGALDAGACPFCPDSAEDIAHLFFAFPRV
jgi:hypothetical protein